MNRNYAPPSKATPTTLCQKCLKRDKFYECTSQQRPYKSRPSRTQQLLNPKLVPQLSEDVPDDLSRKQGVADQQLAKAKEARKQNRSASRSSSASSSVSSISTDKSRSPSPPPKKRRRSVSPEPSKARQQASRRSRSPRRAPRDDRSRSPDRRAEDERRRRRSSTPPVQKREPGRRSLSPFSRRIALTQSMNSK